MDSTAKELQDAADLINKHWDRILVEESVFGLFASKFEVTKARVIGAATDDPGLVLKISRLD